MRKIGLMAATALLALTACGKADETKNNEAKKAEAELVESDGAPAEELADVAKTGAERSADFKKLAAENLAATKAFLAENKTREGVKATKSGLQFIALEEGPAGGASPVSTDLVSFEYATTTADGVEFDSSRARGAAPQVRVSDLALDVPGLSEGLQLMSEGDRYRFFVPPDLAYGDKVGEDAPFGPNETLIFEVELIKVQSPERNLEAAAKFLSDNAKKDGIKTTPSGLQYQVLTEGAADGKTPAATDTVEVHYQGTLLNGTEFDSSYARGQPIEFPLNRVIAGWTEGVQLMNEGDKYRFFIPPALGYGEMGTPGGPIGPNEALIFEVELIAVK